MINEILPGVEGFVGVGLLWLVTGVVPQQFPMRIEIFDIVSGLELCCGRPAGLGYEMIN